MANNNKVLLFLIFSRPTLFSNNGFECFPMHQWLSYGFTVVLSSNDLCVGPEVNENITTLGTADGVRVIDQNPIFVVVATDVTLHGLIIITFPIDLRSEGAEMRPCAR